MTPGSRLQSHLSGRLAPHLWLPQGCCGRGAPTPGRAGLQAEAGRGAGGVRAGSPPAGACLGWARVPPSVPPSVPAARLQRGTVRGRETRRRSAEPASPRSMAKFLAELLGCALPGKGASPALEVGGGRGARGWHRDGRAGPGGTGQACGPRGLHPAGARRGGRRGRAEGRAPLRCRPPWPSPRLFVFASLVDR